MEKVNRNLLMTLVVLIMTVFLPSEAGAASDWTVSPADYRYDMSLYFEASFAATGSSVDLSEYELAAFVGDECRGVAESLSGVEGCLYMRIRSNSESGEELVFRLRERGSGEISEIEGVTLPFESGTAVGLPSDPFRILIRSYYDVVITAAEGGSVDNPGGRYPEGEQLVVTAIPDEGNRFAGWSDGVTDATRTVTVTGDIALEAAFEPALYKLVYKVDGEVYKSIDMAYGAPVVAEAAPEKEGYTFSGWTGLPATMPAHDVEVTGSFSVNTYRLTYVLDGEEYRSFDVPYGAEVVAEASPEREGHTFSGWSGVPATMPAHDVEVTGYFTVNIYRLTVYLDNEVYFETELEMGAPVEIPEPSVPADRKFDGWIEEVPETMPAHDVEIHGTTSVTSVLTNVFKDEDASLTVYKMNGVLLLRDVTIREASERLSKGIYIINGKKIRI